MFEMFAGRVFAVARSGSGRKLILRTVLSCLCVLSFPAWSETVVTHNVSVETLKKENPGYEIELLMLSLDVTTDKYGPYRIQPLRDDMNVARRIEEMNSGKHSNYIRSFSYHSKLEKRGKLIFADYPVYRGILGYRTCFMPRSLRSKISNVKTEGDLLKFTYGLQKGWSDIAILKHNGFSVVESDTYNSLFKMVAANRFALFCRGANEILVEHHYHHHLPGFDYDRSMAIYYPLPHFFYGNKSSKKVIERIEEGLRIAHEQGKVIELWDEYFGESVTFVGLDKRQVFYFENPTVKDLKSDYEYYIYRP